MVVSVGMVGVAVEGGKVGCLRGRTFPLGLEGAFGWIRDMALVVGAINIDAIPAGGKEVVDAQAVRAGLVRESAGVPFTTDRGCCWGGAPWCGEAAEGDAFEFLDVGARLAVSGVTDEHTESLSC